MSRPRPQRRSSFAQWSAAAVTAAALSALPFLLFLALDGSGVAVVLLLGTLLVLGVVAAVRWSPLVVLGLAVLSCLCSVLFFFAVLLAQACGHSTAAAAVQIAGATILGLAVATWGVRGGRHAWWALPAGWAAAAAWIGVLGHLIPGGAGSCFR